MRVIATVLVHRASPFLQRDATNGTLHDTLLMEMSIPKLRFQQAGSALTSFKTFEETAYDRPFRFLQVWVALASILFCCPLIG